MTVLDAGVVIAYFKATDAHHERAKAGMSGWGSEGLVLHAMTLAEVLVQPVRMGREGDVLTAMRELGVEVRGSDPDAALRLARLRVATGLRLPDCCVLDLAEQEDAQLASFDGRLVSVAGSRGIEVVADPT